ncbi:MAG: hypothetical protein GKR89_18805 [Candidatus Latescibacteria bacterium]|nr:hypothetical protein [Candidatus Latescibacterota bacterium]
MLTIGQDGQISWEGDVAVGVAVETQDPEYRTTLDPNVTEVGNTPADLIDFDNGEFPGSILPGTVGEGQNLTTEIFSRGGSLTAPTVFDINDAQLDIALEQLTTAQANGRAFERKGNFVLGTLLVLDLGGRFGVNQIRFFPRNTLFPSPTTPFQGDFLKNFEVHINDGVILTQAGNPIWDFYEGRTNNAEAVTVVDIDPPRLLRFLRLRATSSIPFEIEKIQVFGEGFFPTARYLSPVIDMGSPANWGQLRWIQELVGEADQVDMQIRSRSGSDPTPLAYTRKRVGLQDAAEISASVDDPSQPLERREYLSLPVTGGQSDVWERGSVRDDLENWSPLSPPYSLADGTSEAGTPILSPGPRRYIQFRVDFLSSDLEASYVLNQLAFDFTSPPLADALVGEIFPREVPAATDIPFVYALRTEMESGQIQGFDTFELNTGNRVSRIERIEVTGSGGQILLDHTFATQDRATTEGEVEIAFINDQGFAVRFPRVQEHDSVIKIHFVSRVLSFSTTFEGRALLAAEDAFQGVISGDATQLGEEDIAFKSDVTVLSPGVNSGSLVGNFALDTPVITPNGDGANDRLSIRYEILAVVGSARIKVDIFDVGGRLVRRLAELDGANGVYDVDRLAELGWDGTDGQGGIVPPGLYLIQVEVEGDARSSASVRTFGVAY